MLAPQNEVSTQPPKQRKLSEEKYMRLLFEWIEEFRKINISLQYYLHINPYELELNEWARKVKELEWIRQEEAKANKT